MELPTPGLPGGAGRLSDLRPGQQRVDAVDVDEGPALPAVEVRSRIGERVGPVEPQDDLAVVPIVSLQSLPLPPLPLVAAEVADVESPVGLPVSLEPPLKLDHPLSAGVDGVAAEVAHDPAAAQPLGDGSRRPRAAEEVGDEVALVGGGFDDAFE